MANDATELAVAYISLLPSLQGFEGEVEKQVGNLGVKFGQDFGRDFAAVAQNSAGPDLKKLAAQVDAARSVEADAAGKVRVAEAKLEEIRAKGKGTTAAAVRAEEDLAKATRELDRAQGAAKNAAEAQEHATKDVAEAADHAGDQLDDYRRSTERASKAFGDADKKSGGFKNALFGIGAAAGGIGLAGAGMVSLASGAKDFFADFADRASDINEAGSKVNQIFGKDGAAALDKFAQGADQRLGQTKIDVLDAAGTFGTFGKSAGLAGTDLADFSTDFVQLSSDLASFHNTSPEEAVEAIGAALRGEAEPLRRYGVLLNDAQLREEALKQGLIKTTKQALTPQQKVLAAQALIMKQTKDAQGDFARTSTGLANSQRIAAASADELKRQFGELLLPVFLAGTNLLNQQVLPTIKKLITFISGLGPSFEKAAGPGTQLSGILKAVHDQALVPLVAFIVGQVFPAVLGIGREFQNLYSVVYPIVMQIVGAFLQQWPTIQPVVAGIFESIKSIVLTVLGFVQAYIKRVTDVIGFIWSHWGGQITAVVVGAFRLIVGVIGGAFKVIQGLVQVVTGVLTGDWKKAGEGLGNIVAGIRQMFSAQFTFIKDTIGRLVRDGLNFVRQKFVDFTSWGANTLKAKLFQFAAWFSGPIATARTAIDTILGKVKSAFSSAVTAIGTIWDGLKAKAKEPIRFIVNTVINNGLIGSFNKIAHAVGAKGISTIALPKGFAGGGWTGPGAKYKPAGTVHADEYVFTKEDVRRAGGPGFFDAWRRALHTNRFSRPGDVGLPGFASGGFVKALNYANANEGHPYVFGSIWDCSGFMSSLQRIIGGGGPGRLWATPAFAGGPQHAQGYTKNAKSAFMIGVDPRSGKFGHTAGTLLGHNVESSGGVGVRVDSGARGAGNSYFPLRYGLDKGKGILTKLGEVIKSGFDSVTSWFASLISAPLKKVSQIADSPFGEIVSKVPGLVVEGLKKKVSGYAGGTYDAQAGVKWVGENGPELVNFRGGEQVFNRGMLASGAGAMMGNVTFVSTDPRDDLERLMFEMRRRAGGGR